MIKRAGIGAIIVNYQIFEKINMILSYLEDEESRMIFLQRFLYNVTKDINYIFDIIKYSRYFRLQEVAQKYFEVNSKYDIYPDMDILSFVVNKKQSNNRCIIFGCGAVGQDVYRLLLNAGVDVICFCDNNSKSKELNGKDIINIHDLKKKFANELIIIATIKYQEEILQQLLEEGFDRNQIYCPGQNMFISFFGEPYFDKDIFTSSEDEIFIDGGSYGAETSMDFIKWCPTYKKIYAFEPDLRNYNRCRSVIDKNRIRDIELYRAGLWSNNGILNFTHFGDNGTGSFIESQGEQSVDVLSIDEVLEGNPVTFIKLDIEGAELEALQGAKASICKYRPKMAICIYHKQQDIFEIPLYIKSLVNEYHFAIRHYSTYLYDTVLYCWI